MSKYSIDDYLNEAQVELKRLDHIIYVSLKYTRTVDILKNALNRLVAACEWLIIALLLEAQEKGEIEDIPVSPKLKSLKVRELYPDDKKLHKYLNFYSFLREILNAEYSKEEQYRRHVTLIAHLNNKTARINIDVLEDVFDDLAKEFYDYVLELLGRKEEEDII